MTTSGEEAMRSVAMVHTSQDIVVFAVPKFELARPCRKVFEHAGAAWLDFVSMDRNLMPARYMPRDGWHYSFGRAQAQSSDR